MSHHDRSGCRIRVPRRIRADTVAVPRMVPLIMTLVGLSQSLAAQGNEPSTAPIVPLRDFAGAVRDFGADGWQILSAPARLDARSGAATAATLLVGGILFALDEDVQERLQSRERNGLHGIVRDIGDWWEPVGFQGNTNAALAGLAGLGYLTRQSWLQTPAKQLLYAQWLGGLGRQAVGRLVGRHRPEEGLGAYEFERGVGTSFPSGHAAVVTEVAYVLSHHIRWRPATITLWALAGTVVFQRADADRHWASDAWLGAAWGFAVARIVVAAEENRRLQMHPVADPSTGTYGVGLRIPTP